VTSENNLVPGLRPSYKIGQTRFGFADRNIHRLPNLPRSRGRTETLIRTRVQIKSISRAAPSVRAVILLGLEAQPR
jgi:hypothetical protein